MIVPDPDFYDTGYQAGAADIDPSALLVGTPVIYENRKDYLAGWMLGQAMLARAIRLGWRMEDMDIAAPHRAPVDTEGELRGTGG